LKIIRSKKASREQSIKIIAEIVVNMNFVACNNISNKLKNSTYEIGYYSYTNRYHTLKRQEYADN